MIACKRDPRDVWAFVERICGVCTGTHAIAALAAVEDALQYPVPVQARLMRDLVSGALGIQDHVIHFYQLQAMDWVDVMSALKADPRKPPPSPSPFPTGPCPPPRISPECRRS